MKVTDRTRLGLAFRKERRDLEAKGYRLHETDWEVHRGHRYDEIILDAKISVDGKYVYTLLGKPVDRTLRWTLTGPARPPAGE